MSTDKVSHLGLGRLAEVVGLSVPKKAELMEALKLGAGATAAITLTDLLLSRVLVKNGRPLVPEKWSPLAIAALSVVAGRIAKRKLDADLGLGMVAGGVGVAVSALLAKFTSPAMAASAASAAASEASGEEAQAMAGFGLGRAFAPGLGGLGRIGRALPAGTSLYGVGTPNMSAAKMFNGATVAIEDNNGLAGATVAIEDAPNFASSLM